MKKIVLLATVAMFSLTAVNAQKKDPKVAPAKITSEKVETPKVDGAGMVFENETIDYGTIPADSDGNRKFEFTNNGNKPLIITETHGSCGCTVPTTPKEPIAPGAKGFIGVHYATDRAGQTFTKTVTVTSNAVGQETKVLTIKGNVLPRETKSTPAAPTKS